MLKKYAFLPLVAMTLALSFRASAQAPEPIKIGVLTIDSGTFASIQPLFVEPIKFAVEQFNKEGGVIGRKFEVVMQAAATPASALPAVQRMVRQDGVHFVSGFTNSSVALALGPRMAAMNALLLDGASQTDGANTTCNSHHFRGAATDGAVANTLRQVMVDSGIKNWNVIVSDYALGRAFERRMTQIVDGLGGKVRTTVIAPMANTDFGAQISLLASNPAEGLAVHVVGNDAITFAKQQKQFGLFDRYKTIVSANFTTDPVLAAQGDSTVGLYSSASYSPEMLGAKNEKFVREWKSRYNRTPNYFEADVYQMMEVFKAAIQKAGSADVEAVRKAMRGLKVDTIMGSTEMRAADQTLVRPMVLVQVESAGAGTARFALRRTLSAAEVTPAPTVDCTKS